MGCSDAYRNKWNHSSSFLFEKVLTRCPAEDQEVIATGLLNDSPGIFASLVHRRGPLTKALSKLPGETPLRCLDALRIAAGKQPAGKYKKKLQKGAADHCARWLITNLGIVVIVPFSFEYPALWRLISSMIFRLQFSVFYNFGIKPQQDGFTHLGCFCGSF